MPKPILRLINSSSLKLKPKLGKLTEDMSNIERFRQTYY